MHWAKTTARRHEKHLSLGFGVTYIRGLMKMVILYAIICCISPHYMKCLLYNTITMPCHNDIVSSSCLLSPDWGEAPTKHSGLPCICIAFWCIHVCKETIKHWYLTHWPLADLREIWEKVIFKLILMIGGWGIFCKIALRWMSMDLTDDKSTLVQMMAWCRQATSHYPSQCWPRSMSPYVVTRPQWVNNKISQISTRQIRTPVLRIPPAVTSQAKMKNWLHECQKWVSHMIGHYAHI